jgi:hypothetical protein
MRKMKRPSRHTYLTSIFAVVTLLFLYSCKKEVTIDLPEVESKIVVEGHIEQNVPPYVILTKSTGYFDPTDINSIEDLFIRNAIVSVHDGTTSFPLTELCSSSLPDSLLPLISEFVGIDPASLANFDYCVYTTLDPAAFGQVGKSYALTIDADGEILTATTKIPQLAPLDSVWFAVYGDRDSLGFPWATLTDPDTVGNSYRWLAKRINKYTYGENVGEQKDPYFVPPFGSAFDDQFFNGLTFEFAYDRGFINGSDKEDDTGDERGFYKVGDTIAVKFSTINYDVFEFIRMMETQAAGNGSPFASPANIPSNITGNALGVWAGYGVAYDTIICTN